MAERDAIVAWLDELVGIEGWEDYAPNGLQVPGAEEVELRRSEIAVLRPGRESLMPRGLEANMSRDELADLLAFLGSLN